MFVLLRPETLSGVPGKRLFAGVGFAVAGLLGVAAALATAGCGSGGNGGLSTVITSSLPSLTRPATTTSPPEGETQTTVSIGTTTEAAPAVTVTETFPAVTETLPARTVTVTKTETLPVATETLAPTTETLPATTVTTTAVNPAAAAAAGAAVASASQEEASSETPWGWIAFAILAVGVVAGALVWWLRKRADRKGDEATSPPTES